MKRLTAEELKKLLLVKNVIAAVPLEENCGEDAQCMVREVKSDNTESAKDSNTDALRSK